MGYYTDLLKKIEIVEAQGFDPYTDLYASRVGQLQTTSPEGNTPEVIQPQTMTPLNDTIATPNISDIFTTGGYGDPYENIISTSGNLNLSQLSQGYNTILGDPELAKQLPPERYIEDVNTRLKKDVEKEYGEGKSLVVDPDTKTLSISKPTEENVSYRFEIGKKQGAKTGEDPNVYYRWDDKGNYITYPDKDSYDKALKEYKSIEDLNVNSITKKAKK